MKVLLVTDSYWPNADGGALFERRLVLGEAARGHHMAVIAPAPTFRVYHEQDGPYLIYRQRGVPFLANRKYRVSLLPLFGLFQTIRKERPDVIHIHNCYRLGLLALLWAKYFRIPVVATNHFMPENALLNLRWLDMLYKPLHYLIWKYLVWFHNRADFVTSPTPTAVKLLVDHGLHIQAKAITNGIDTEVFKPEMHTAFVKDKYKIASDRPVLLYMGRLDGEKRIDLILQAVAIAEKKQPLQLILAGFGKAQAELKQLATDLRISEHVIFTGYVEEDHKAALYNASDIFVMASPAELQSIVMLEAMACGLPILSVNVAALSELCHNEKNGLLFKRDDFNELAYHMQRLCSNAKLRKAFGEQSRQIIMAHHSTEVTFKEYEAVYMALL